MKIAPAESGLLPESISAESDKGIWKVTFRFKPEAPDKRVSLAGSFNGWNPEAQVMTGSDGNGIFSTTIPLGTGDYQYKFVADGRWLHDPKNPATEPDGHNGFNSILKLGQVASLTASPGKLGDGSIEAMGLLHDAALPKYVQPLEANKVLLRLRTFAHDVSAVWAAVRGGSLTAMAVEGEGPLFAYWEATVTLPKGSQQASRTAGGNIPSFLRTKGIR
jgi:hypothetical protein